MCGRARIGARAIAVSKRIDPSLVIEVVENLHPGMCVPVIMSDPTSEGKLAVEMMTWGLISSVTHPPHAKLDHFMMFNARVETVLSKKSFAKLMHSKRCGRTPLKRIIYSFYFLCLFSLYFSVVALDGFYEWMKQADRKQP